MTNRERPNNRRPSLTRSFEYDGQERVITVGFYANGRACEMFVTGFGKDGSERVEMINDICVILSYSLQSGFKTDDLARRLTREGAPKDGLPGNPVAASVVGTIIQEVAHIECDEHVAIQMMVEAVSGQDNLLKRDK